MNEKWKLIFAGMTSAVLAVGLTRKRFQTLPYGYGSRIKKSIKVNSSPESLYAYWRRIENLQQMFHNVVSVSLIDSTRSLWTMRAPGGVELKWTAEITIDRQNEMIGWRSVGRAGLDNAGYIRFEPAANGDGTVVTIAMQFNPPAGKLGSMVATLLGEQPAAQVEEALRKFKQLIETTQKFTSKGNHIPEEVDVASEDSFPASDPPSWTGTTGRPLS